MYVCEYMSIHVYLFVNMDVEMYVNTCVCTYAHTCIEGHIRMYASAYSHVSHMRLKTAA